MMCKILNFKQQPSVRPDNLCYNMRKNIQFPGLQSVIAECIGYNWVITCTECDCAWSPMVETSCN